MVLKSWFHLMRGDVNIQKYNENLWFKLLCFYYTKTEEYDRGLTDLRSPYDPTEAYITGENRKMSTWYATKLWNFILNTVSAKNHIPKPMVEKYLKEVRVHNLRYSAQWWIDTYNHLCKNGEMDIVEEIIGYK